MSDILYGKKILITGGCGSIGSEIASQLIGYKPESITVFDNNETAHFNFNQKINNIKINNVEIINLIGDIRDRERVDSALRGIDIVFHAAALKHVPFCEQHPFEAINTNIIGARNVVDCAISNNVERVIGISTDKAVNPINTMGATKLLGEKIFISSSCKKSKTKISCVRFGNVLNSSGSVIPIFYNQIKHGGPITITSRGMTRFFMTMEEAVGLVVKSSSVMDGGEIFILKMNALKINDLAHVMREELAPVFNFKPEEIEIEEIGPRTGEKMEELLVAHEEIPLIREYEGMYILSNRLESDFDRYENRTINCNSAEVPVLSRIEIKQKLQSVLNLEGYNRTSYPFASSM